ncbi:MAG TPA: hypothetical protein VHG71_04835 [Verrucomicrobiae bacterium]|nr:hypothetical protein [Verrucomicrobiae bacterium]
MISLIHITATYSNAVLVAILPHISNVVQKLDLSIPTPITAGQVEYINVSLWKDNVGGTVFLTNQYSFEFQHGYVSAFHALKNNPFYGTGDRDALQMLRPYVGSDNITTNEAIELVRNSFYKLGYNTKDFNIEGSPTVLQGPINSKKLGHIPYCQIEWDSPHSRIRNWLSLDYNIRFEVDMQRKQIVGMNLSGKPFFQPNPRIDVKPELETNYQSAGMAGQMAQLINREPLIHMTSTYSNATLTAVLPYVTDFAKNLDLPTIQPLTSNQVFLFLLPRYYTNDGFNCTVILTNHLWFTFLTGFITDFGSPNDWFEEGETKTNWPAFDEKTCMTTNETIQFVRDIFRELGYPPEKFHLNDAPTSFELASDNQKNRYAYCRVDWESTDEEQNNIYQIQFDIDVRQKRVVGATLISKEFMRPLPQIDIKPELESDYQKRIQGKMFIRTNAPTQLNQSSQSPPYTNQFRQFVAAG